jgi:hypothetical protein
VAGLTGYPAPTVTYVWEASADGTTFSTVGSGAGYTPGAGDEGSVLRVTATADNSIGTPATATSSVTSAVAGAPAGGMPGSPVDPGTPPGTPFDVTAIAGDEAATVSWAPPTNHGDYPITTYQVRATPGGASCLTEELSCLIEDLDNGTAYSMTVRALSGAGWSSWSSPSAEVTPSAVPVPSITLKQVARSNSAVEIAGTTVAVTEGQMVRIRVATFKVKSGGWTRFRTVSRVQVSNGGFAADLRWGKATKIRVLAKADGVTRSNMLRIDR